MDHPRPQVVAHRGASSEAAEHTLGSYELALSYGVDAVECDVRLTRDGVLVCVHDRRVDRTSSGRGAVSALELADLQELDFASWHRRRGGLADPLLTADWEAPDRDRSGVLTLDRLVRTVLGAEHRVEIAIEAKHPTRYAGLVERAVAGLLTEHGLVVPDNGARYRARVMSFSGMSLRRIRALLPGLPTVLLLVRLPRRYRDGTLPPYASAAGPSVRLVRRDPDYVRRVHERGGEVHVWTVNEPADVELMLELGVDAIITDRPRQVLRQVRAATG